MEYQQVDRATVQQARSLLESLMLRRLKSAVESSLAPKLEFVLKVRAYVMILICSTMALAS